MENKYKIILLILGISIIVVGIYIFNTSKKEQKIMLEKEYQTETEKLAIDINNACINNIINSKDDNYICSSSQSIIQNISKLINYDISNYEIISLKYENHVVINLTLKRDEKTYEYNHTAKTTGINSKCIRADINTLNTETCVSEICSTKGSSIQGTIVYGNKQFESGKLKSGDAFDCDVNGDGKYNEKTERFYYVTSLNNNTNYAVLIYNDNVANSIAYDYDGIETSGPVTASGKLPSISEWKNISLSSNNRIIKNDEGKVVNKNFEYNNNVARLLTLDEARKVCATNKDGFIKVENCKYLLENTGYATGNEKSYWLETRSSVQPTAAWWIDGNTGYNAVYESDNGVRPVIEILKSEITY